MSRTVPADSSAPALLRDVCRRWLHGLGWPDEDADGLLIAATEAVTNVVAHAYRPPVVDQLHHLVWFEAACTTHPSGQRRVIISVTDTGQWKPAPGDSGGGLARMRERLSTLDVEAGETGTTVRLTSHPLPRRSASTGAAAGGAPRRRRRARRQTAQVPTPRRPQAARTPVSCSADLSTT